MDNAHQIALKDILEGDAGKWAYLFPYRKNVPKISKHIFTDLKSSSKKIDEYIIEKLLDINYIGWTCKVILNIDLFPIQIAILQILWKTPFPLLVASRGGSKTFILAVYAILKALLDPGSKVVIIGAGLRQAKLVFGYIENIWNSAPILRNIVGGGKNAGPRQNVDLCYFKLGPSSIVALPTGDGQKIRGFRASCIIADEFACLDKNTLVETNNGLERISDISYLGTSVINKDGDFEPINSFIKTPKTDIYEVLTKYGYGFKCSNIHKVLTTNGWKLGKDLTNDDFLIIKNKYIFPNSSVDDFVTEDIAWLMGLLVSEGDITHEHHIGITTTDTSLVKRFMFKFAELNPKIYTRKECTDKRGWKCKESYDIRIHNTIFREKLYSLGMDYVGSHNKSIPSIILKSPKNIIISFLSGLFEGDGSCFLWKDRNTTKLGVAYYTVSDILAQDVQTLLLKLDIISSRRTRDSKISNKKQWMLRCNGRYALGVAELLNIPKWNNILSKSQTHLNSDDYCVTFDKCRNKWMARVGYGGKIHNLGRYLDKQDAINIVKGFFATHDQCARVEKVVKLSYQDYLYDFYLPKTHSFYGNGFVQHNSVPEDVFDIVVRGFAATSKTPVDEARRAAINKKIQELGLPETVQTQLNNQKIKGNQIIYSGTAYYQFNHFAKKFHMWKEIISANGNMEKIADIFGGANNIPENFDTRDYALIRLPSEYLPDGLLDKKQLAHAKATLPKNIYDMEYNACTTGDCIVDTNNGAKKIIDINIGDYVFTHSLRYRRVIKKTFRHYEGYMVRLKIGLDETVDITSDHPIWNGDNFVKAIDLKAGDIISYQSPKLQDNYIFDLGKICGEYQQQNINDTVFIYPTPSQVINNKHSNNADSILQRLYYRPDEKFKSSIPRYIPSSFGLGYILGIYAGDGCINKTHGRQMIIVFNITQEDRAKKFINYIKNIFGLESKFSLNAKDHTLCVRTNSRLLCDFVGAMVGHLAIGKRIFNVETYTEEMGKGFIAGYFDSDGHIGPCTATIGSINRSLLWDTRLLLSSLGCYCGIRHVKTNKKTCTFRDTIYNCKPSYVLSVPSTFKSQLLRIINNEKINKNIKINVTKKDVYNYSGTVYNLEVEEDHSYFAMGCFHHNCFIADSDGHFARSLIEACTVKPGQSIMTSDGEVSFVPMMRGITGRKYVVGIDPASEVDRFAITVLEAWKNHYRIVYCWSINKPEFNGDKKAGLIKEGDYYDYCCAKIRDIVKLFKPIRIEMDSQGGGYPISEMLRSKKGLDKEVGEFPIYEVVDPNNIKETDGESDGPHILNLIQQSNEFNSYANAILHKSLETKRLLFPAFDTVVMQSAIIAEKSLDITTGTFEECVYNIEELKNELCTIQKTETTTGKERFDTPNSVTSATVEGRYKKGRLRKDRYTSLLLAHKYIYSMDTEPESSINYSDVAGNFKKVKNVDNQPLYIGPGLGGFTNSDQWCKSKNMKNSLKNGERI